MNHVANTLCFMSTLFQHVFPVFRNIMKKESKIACDFMLQFLHSVRFACLPTLISSYWVRFESLAEVSGGQTHRQVDELGNRTSP